MMMISNVATTGEPPELCRRRYVYVYLPPPSSLRDLLAGMTRDELLHGVEGLLATVRNLMASHNARNSTEHSLELPEEEEERFQEE
ncbi:hypothetical protein ACP70R_008809 [Stipagrostis hirtigluma subsp. patula]